MSSRNSICSLLIIKPAEKPFFIFYPEKNPYQTSKKMAKKIVWSVQAQSDRKEILLFWKNKNKSDSYSKKLNYLFKDAAKTISLFPNIGKPTDYKDTRIKIVRDYLMIYKEFENFISVVAIWDSRQNPVKLERIIK